MKEHNANGDTFLQSVSVVASGLSLKSHTWTGEASASQDRSCPAWFVSASLGAGKRLSLQRPPLSHLGCDNHQHLAIFYSTFLILKQFTFLVSCGQGSI